MWYTIVEGDWLVIDDGIAELHWLSCDPESGEIDPDSNTDVILTINAVGLLEGDYVADIHFISNDPETSDAAVRLLMHITAAPVIEVTWDDDAGYPDRIDWNQAYLDVFTGVPYPIPVTIKNIGTTALEVDDILSEEQVFSSDQNEFVLDPDDEMVVNFILETEEEGIFESEMVIVWNSPNDEDAVIHLIGRTSLPPVIEVDPTDIEAHLEVGDSDDQIVNITNAGSSTLRFEIEHVIISEPERDRSEQPGPQRDDFGDIINEFNVGVGYWSGLACDGELMWGININQGRMISFDPEAEEVVEEVNLRGEYYGMTYDGEFFWIGTVGGDDMNARILRIDRNGDVSQTINVPGWQATGVAFDGENLWYYSNDWEQEAVIIRQITTEGDQIREINCSNILQGGMISLAWVPEHEDGNLWAIGWEARTIYQLNISEDDPEALQETRIIGANVFGLEHDGENMWYCTVDDVWYVIDDGLNESNWLSYDPKEGELDAHAEIDIFVTLDATEALEGDYEADMHIFSNDPDNSDLIINIIMSVGQSSAPLESAVPDDYHLSAAYPNPFNAMTTIRYALPHSASISLQVYDINGRLTTTLFTGERSAGHYSTIWNAQSNPTGMYFIRMDTPDFNAVRKVVLTK